MLMTTQKEDNKDTFGHNTTQYEIDSGTNKLEYTRMRQFSITSTIITTLII